MLTTASQPTRYQNICLITIGKIVMQICFNWSYHSSKKCIDPVDRRIWIIEIIFLWTVSTSGQEYVIVEIIIGRLSLCIVSKNLSDVSMSLTNNVILIILYNITIFSYEFWSNKLLFLKQIYKLVFSLVIIPYP